MSQNQSKKTQTKPKTNGAESVFSEFGIHSSPSAPSEAPAKSESPKAAPSPAPASKPAQTTSPQPASSTKKTTSSEKKPTSAKGGRTTVRTTTAPKSNPKSKNDNTKNVKKKEAESDDMFRADRPAHRVIPYFLCILALFLGITLLLNLFCNVGNKLESTPEEHWMGVVGYYICYGLFGLFGPAAFAIPILTFNIGVFWKKFINNRVTTSKIIVSMLTLILLSSFIHVFYLITENIDYPAKELITYGAQMAGGGLLGGKLAFFTVHYLNVTGAMICYMILLVLSAFYCLGMTPQNLWNRIYIRCAIKRRSKAANKEEGEEAASNDPVKAEGNTKKPQADSRKDKKVENASDAEQSNEENWDNIPIPELDPSGGTKSYIPADVQRALKEEERKARMAIAAAQSNAPAPSNSAPPPSHSTTESTNPKSGEKENSEYISKPYISKENPVASEKNRDTSINQIFPTGSEHRQKDRIMAKNKEFDLKKVFVDFDDETAQPQKAHATLPPEVPLSADASAQSGNPAARPKQPLQSPASHTTVAAKASATGVPTATQAPKRPTAAPVAAKQPATMQKPITEPVDTSDLKDFGLTSDEFEKLEAERGIHKIPAKPSVPAQNAPKAPITSTVTKLSNKKYVFPPTDYLHPVEKETEEFQEEVQKTMDKLSETMQSFNVGISKITHAHGPTVTRYELYPKTGVRVKSIVNLADDIALALAAGSIRIEAPIPGKSAVGIEVTNKLRRTVFLRQLIEDQSFVKATSKLTASLGADIAGNPLFFDISKMPHLLVAGTTNSGKSVCINCIIMSLLYKARADEVKLLLIDPKKVEFGVYKNIPHLLAPIITTPKDAAGALQASVEEMERRFTLFEQVGSKDIKGYNETTKNDPDMPFLPYIVIIIDELADLMMTASDEVETAICRIAQKARAAGMHLIVGTQRPSVDVVTGLIKSNVPSRIAFTVASQVDSKTILDYAGAEKLAGRGDMLFAPIGAMKPARVQGAFVDEKEVERICEFLRANNGDAKYDEGFISKLKELAAQCGNKSKGGEPSALSDTGDGKDDSLYSNAVRVAVEENRISTSLLQRKLSIGYGRAAKLIDRMQSEGIVSPPDGAKPRTVLITAQEYIARFVDGKNEDKDDDTGEE